jgi:hypothetical protein
MEIDKEKVDEITLALLYLTTFRDKHGLRAWPLTSMLIPVSRPYFVTMLR